MEKRNNGKRHLNFYSRRLHEYQTYDLDNLRMGMTVRTEWNKLYDEFKSIISSTQDAFQSLYPNNKSSKDFFDFMNEYQEEDLMRAVYLWKKYLGGPISLSPDFLRKWLLILKNVPDINKKENQTYLDNGYDSIALLPYNLNLMEISCPNLDIGIYEHLLWCFKTEYPKDYDKKLGIEQIEDEITVYYQSSKEYFRLQPYTIPKSQETIELPGKEKIYNPRLLIVQNYE